MPESDRKSVDSRDHLFRVLHKQNKNTQQKVRRRAL